MQNNNAANLNFNPAPKPICPALDPGSFREQVIALFDGKGAGGLSTYFYSSPKFHDDPVNGYGLFRDLCAHPDYYIRREETGLIVSMQHKIAQILGAEAAFIELGPGAKETVNNKTLPVLRAAIRPQTYVAVDYNSISAVQAADSVLSHLPHIRAEVVTEDFTQLLGFGDQYRNPVFLMFGNTLGNIEGLPNVFNPNIVAYLETLKKVIGRSGKLLMAYDCNQDAAMIEAAYNNLIAKAWIHNIIFRMQRDTGLMVDAALLEPYAEFKSDNYCVEIGLRATADQTVRLDSHVWNLQAGQKLHVYNSYKFVPQILRPLLQRAGLSSRALFVNNNHTAALELVEPL